MDSVINKLTEIEEAADALCHAEEQKAFLTRSMKKEKKRLTKNWKQKLRVN